MARHHQLDLRHDDEVLYSASAYVWLKKKRRRGGEKVLHVQLRNSSLYQDLRYEIVAKIVPPRTGNFQGPTKRTSNASWTHPSPPENAILASGQKSAHTRSFDLKDDLQDSVTLNCRVTVWRNVENGVRYEGSATIQVRR